MLAVQDLPFTIMLAHVALLQALPDLPGAVCDACGHGGAVRQNLADRELLCPPLQRSLVPVAALARFPLEPAAVAEFGAAFAGGWLVVRGREAGGEGLTS